MKHETKKDYQERIIAVLLYIQENLHKNLSLEELSQIACFSPFHFHRIFKGMVGETLSQHVRRLRLERAAVLLSISSASVTELAFESGYDSVESFTRAFRDRFDMPPTEWRKQNPKHYLSQNKQLPNLIQKGDIMIEGKIQTLPARKVAFIRHIGPYSECCKVWQTLCAWAGQQGLINDRTVFLGMCYDDPEVTPADKIRYDACITIDRDIKPQGEIGIQEIPEAEYATFLHKGPFETLKDTYVEIYSQWFPRSGREAAHQACIEVYLNDPEKTPPEELLVEIQAPVANQ